MEENGSEKEKLTLRDWGRGFMFLGAVLLMLTVFLYIMASLNQEYYGLFTGETHLRFYTATGTTLIVTGAAFVMAHRKRNHALR